MASKEADVLVGRRCLAKGYVDQALEFFTRGADVVEAEDWITLREQLLERGRIHDMVRVCELGHVPVPREQLLAHGDRALVTKDLELVLQLFELAGADRERWEKVVDVLITMPERRRQAVAVADRHLVTRAAPMRARVHAGTVNIRAVK